jgi:hypothetical protein
MSIYARYSVPQFSTTNKELGTESFRHLGNLFKTQCGDEKKSCKAALSGLETWPVVELSRSRSVLKAAYACD